MSRKRRQSPEPPPAAAVAAVPKTTPDWVLQGRVKYFAPLVILATVLFAGSLVTGDLWLALLAVLLAVIVSRANVRVRRRP